MSTTAELLHTHLRHNSTSWTWKPVPPPTKDAIAQHVWSILSDPVGDSAFRLI